MKKWTKITSAIIASIMIFAALMIPGLAETDYSKVNIIINDNVPAVAVLNEGAPEADNADTADTVKYKGYMLMSATVSVKDETDGKTTYNAVYTVNEKYRDILKTALGITDEDTATADSKIIEAIRGKSDTDLKALADTVYRAIKADSNIEPTATTTTNTFNDVKTGYWLVASDAVDEKGAPLTLALLDTVGKTDAEIKPKHETDTPDVEKDVTQNDNNTWQKHADYSIGDTVPFRLIGTLPTEYSRYESYKYAFHDTLSGGLTLNADSIRVYAVKSVGVPTTGSVADVANAVELKKVDVATDESGYSVTIGTDANNSTVIDIAFADLKAATAANTGESVPALDKTYKIVVEYNAVLNTKAVIAGEGNPNQVKLEYSNDPYGTGTGTTDEKVVKVFTYELIVNKTDGTNPLKGADFTLQKKSGDTYVDVVVTENAGDANAKVVKKYFDKEGNTTTQENAVKFTFEGLDAGEYKLVESKVPGGYNKAADVVFTVTVDYSGITDGAADGSLVAINSITTTNKDVTVNADKNLTTTVVNNAGQELPETGGMGRTILYLIGAFMVCGAGVLLVTKKLAKNKRV